MFTKKIDPVASELDRAITRILSEMEKQDPSSKEYSAMSDQLKKLYRLKTMKRTQSVSPDTIVAVAGNLAGILLILNFERVNVVTTKALGFVMKSRL